VIGDNRTQQFDNGTDEANASIIVHVLQISFFRNRNKERWIPWTWNLSALKDPIEQAEQRSAHRMFHHRWIVEFLFLWRWWDWWSGSGKKNQLSKLHSNLIISSNFTMRSEPKGAQLAKKVMVSSIVEFVTPQDNAIAELEIRIVRKIAGLLF